MAPQKPERDLLATPNSAELLHSKTIASRLNQARPMRPARFDAQFTHLVNQRGARQTEPRSSATLSAVISSPVPSPFPGPFEGGSRFPQGPVKLVTS